MSIGIKEILWENPICAIMRDIPTEKAIAYARAAYRGGIRAFEVAMNTPDAARQIGLLRREFGTEAYIGAGTVISRERCQEADDAGAQFFLTPNVATETLRYCRSHDIPLLPGVMTPTDVGICLEYGYRVMKLFPAGELPMTYLKSLKGPFDDTEYIAVGGVRLDNIAEFFRAGFIGAGIGSNLIPKEYVERGDWDGAAVYVGKFYEKIAAFTGN